MRLLALTALLLAALPIGVAEGKPKTIGTTGCTQEQIETDGAKSCMKKAEDDLLNSRPTQHIVHCTETGVIMCCMADDDGIVDHSCEDARESTLDTVLKGDDLDLAPVDTPTDPLGQVGTDGISRE